MTPQERAEQSAKAMLAHDGATVGAGVRFVSVAEGRAVMQMAVEDRHLNGHGMCHGGYIFLLADTAFAVACNSRNQVTVAQENQITYVSPGQPGEVLTATAQEVALNGRSGVYDVTVRGADDRVVALMRGLARQIKGQHFEEDT
ncbi:hydroxyphenylacetyl-CoA thioesterase PaaI [Shimia ponticola]|uniref:hydroxyphenylacetyl-CoA thioesterase PaaI n=1 Tax=Shimia ponticola TaxID=2582893 RepID=UPI0011BEA57A|nr:hydroxyphenylacetyl-CoA thioesterase PaaI [Shimia ponticola]